jgi:hypothetical protein
MHTINKTVYLILAVVGAILMVFVYAIHGRNHSNRNTDSGRGAVVPWSNSGVSITGGDITIMPRKLTGLSSNDFQNVVVAAERDNDVGAAVDLANYYGYVVNDVTNRIKYLRIAASHGHVISQYNLGFIYANYDEFKNLNEAKYWLKIAASNGSSYAQEQLKLIGNK